MNKPAWTSPLGGLGPGFFAPEEHIGHGGGHSTTGEIHPSLSAEASLSRNWDSGSPQEQETCQECTPAQSSPYSTQTRLHCPVGTKVPNPPIGIPNQSDRTFSRVVHESDYLSRFLFLPPHILKCEDVFRILSKPGQLKEPVPGFTPSCRRVTIWSSKLPVLSRA